MRQQLHRQEKEMIEANSKISFLMNHLGFLGSSSRPPQPTNESYQYEDDVEETSNESDQYKDDIEETHEEDVSNEF